MKPATASNNADAALMQAALGLARLGVGGTRPNPPVGAVIARDGVIIGSGRHHAAGLGHAEVEAIADCRARGGDSRGAAIYVTLEPCSTFGRTPPCVDAIKSAGIARVVIGAIDPNPKHAGRGAEILRSAGIEVTCGVCEDEAKELILPFATRMLEGRPYLTVKMAQSLDGAISDYRGESKWISSVESRERVAQFRDGTDAVIAGIGTLLADDPSLLRKHAPNVTHCPRATDAEKLQDGRYGNFRVIVDATGRAPLSSRVFTDGSAARTIIATTAHCPAVTLEAIRATGAQAWVLPADPRGGEAGNGGDVRPPRVDLRELLKRLAEAGFMHVMCEGGGTLAGAFVGDGLADEIKVFVAPFALGGRGASSFGRGRVALTDARRYEFAGAERVGGDMLLTLRRAK